jgi:UDP-N-acetylglucosamine 2-epimerase (non-hydrolysing)
MKLLHVVGTRPNFMKIAPVMRAAEQWNLEHGADSEPWPVRFEQVLVHTGQHYDERMSKVFFSDLALPVPDYYLEVGSGSHAQQTGAIMLAFEPVLIRECPDIVVVVGDVNSTLAAALVAGKLQIPIAHVEAGLRSHDRAMPEELNRVLTDHLSEVLFATCRDGCDNLNAEGIAAERVHLVGNPMIDTLDACLQQALQSPVLAGLNLRPQEYALVTLHRPSNVDDHDQLALLMDALLEVCRETAVVFPVHMRTREQIQRAGLADRATEPGRLLLIEPLGYLDFLALMASAACVLTDSGGVQEETTVLGVPCITLRTTTERPITIYEGTNRLVDPSNVRSIVAAALEALSGPRVQTPRRPRYWDGHASERIVATLAAWVPTAGDEGRTCPGTDSGL